jgi:hypothetical protein
MGGPVTTPSSSTPPLPLPLLTRDQEAQVATDEANARKAAADADTSALSLAQAKYKSLVPDLTQVALSTVDDKSADVAFSGLVTYSALNHAAEIVAHQVSQALGTPADNQNPTILVTSQSDLLTNDLLSITVAASLRQLSDFADEVLKLEPPSKATSEKPVSGDGDTGARRRQLPQFHVEMLTKAADASLAGVAGSTAAIGAGAAATAFGPLGLAAAAAAAIPSIVSLFSSTTTVKSQSEAITDLATTTSVMSAVAGNLASYTVAHEDFRLAPARSAIRNEYHQLALKRMKLVFKQEQMQVAKNEADLDLARAQQQLAAKKKSPPKADGAGHSAQEPSGAGDSADAVTTDSADAATVDSANAATMDSANAAAALSVITGAIASIDAFTTAANATAAGTRSPLAIASLNELLHAGEKSGINYVLSVKGLGGQSEEFTKNRHVGFDTYTTLADASISFMLYDTAADKVISSGVANGVSSVHGRLGHPPTGLIGPNASDVIGDQFAGGQASDAGQEGQPAEHPHRGWRRFFGGD